MKSTQLPEAPGQSRKDEFVLARPRKEGKEQLGI